MRVAIIRLISRPAKSSTSSRMRVMTHNWSAMKQRLHPQSVAEINHHSVLTQEDNDNGLYYFTLLPSFIQIVRIMKKIQNKWKHVCTGCTQMDIKTVLTSLSYQ